MTSTTQANGIHSPSNKQAGLGSTAPRIVLAGKTGKILCVADIRGDCEWRLASPRYQSLAHREERTGIDQSIDHELNRLIREHEATAVIHTGDFGFINVESLDRMGDK